MAHLGKRNVLDDVNDERDENALEPNNIDRYPLAWAYRIEARHRSLPDLENGEVEIARLTVANSVHGEVTSLRAKLTKQDGKIFLRMVDEYESEIKLPYQLANMPLTSEQVIGVFRDADPTATKFGCDIEFQSFFHADLNEVAQRLGVK